MHPLETMRLAFVLATAAGCAASHTPEPVVRAELGDVHVLRAPASHASQRMRYHMRDYLRDLRESQRALVDGRLDEARMFAFAVTRIDERQPWTVDTARVAREGEALATADTPAEALDVLPRLAYACAVCHRRTGDVDGDARDLPIPAVPEPAMARHGWAVDRMLDSLVIESDRCWTTAWATLAQGGPLAAQARDVVAAPVVPPQLRPAAYRRVLATCAGCHGTR